MQIVKRLAFFIIPCYNRPKGIDEDSNFQTKAAASRGRCKPDASSVRVNIPSELSG